MLLSGASVKAPAGGLGYATPMASESEHEPQLVIVIGRGHSGTRAISRTLSESGVYMGAQLNGSYDLIPPEELYEACRVMARRIVHRGGLEWDFSRLFEEPIDPEFERLVRSYAKSVLEHSDGPRGWKLPETTLVLPWIVRMFPGAFYISWVRDPRDSILGKHLTDDLADFGVPYERPEDLLSMRATSWKYQREIVSATPRPDHWIDVRFEDFVLEQEATLTRLERFLMMPLVRVPVKPEAIGRWQEDAAYHEIDFLTSDLESLGYIAKGVRDDTAGC
jgi:hypothetical protein